MTGINATVHYATTAFAELQATTVKAVQVINSEADFWTEVVPLSTELSMARTKAAIAGRVLATANRNTRLILDLFV